MQHLLALLLTGAIAAAPAGAAPAPARPTPAPSASHAPAAPQASKAPQAPKAAKSPAAPAAPALPVIPATPTPIPAVLTPAPAASGPAPAASVAPGASAPAKSPAVEGGVVIRIGTAAVMTIRAGEHGETAAARAAVVQSRINQVLLNHPYLTHMDVKVLREGVTPVIFWGAFPIVSADPAHARLNNFSSPDILAHAWANSLRKAIKGFFAGKKLPERALYRNPAGSDFVYRRSEKTVSDPTQLRNTRYVFSPEDLVWGAGVKAAGQNGFVIFTKRDAENPPAMVFLGNPQGTFTEYDLISPEEQP